MHGSLVKLGSIGGLVEVEMHGSLVKLGSIGGFVQRPDAWLTCETQQHWGLCAEASCMAHLWNSAALGALWK